MKNLYLFLLFCGFVFPVFSQTPDVQVDRRIYLWDVTWSMQGHTKNPKAQYGADPKDKYPYNKDLDIWDGVAAFLKNDINKIANSNTELILLPFRTKIEESLKKVKADSEGKAVLCKYIDEAKKEFGGEPTNDNIGYLATNTNIVKPLQEVMSKYIDTECNNLLILLTDGKSNDGADNQEALMKLLSSWDVYVAENNIYLIYMMLSDAAKDEGIKETLDNVDNAEVVENEIDFEFIDAYPERKIDFNIADDMFVTIPFNASMPTGTRMAVKSSSDALITIDEEAEVENETLKFSLKYNSKELKELMDVMETVNIPLTLEILNRDKIQQTYKKRLILKRKNVELALINKIQKTLTINVK